MTKQLQAIRGMNDLLPDELISWQVVESHLKSVLTLYDYSEIRSPILEYTGLFCRSIGEMTDIVEKEMYTFEDRNGDSLTLRPEGTVGCVRAVMQNGLLNTPDQRLWYMGPMFRHERPQKGRYRQFHQCGAETFGIATADIDAELIVLSSRFWRVLGIDAEVELQLNSLGSLSSRASYREKLVAYFSRYKNDLDEDSLRRLESNPLRILDSKNPKMVEINANAPELLASLDEDSKIHFDVLQQHLDQAKVSYTINPRLVRGLDYYNRTVFEWVTESLGAQGTICAGGRYDGLVEQLGGKSTPAAGFALGLERLVSLVSQHQALSAEPLDAYLLAVGENVGPYALYLSEQLRTRFPKLRLRLHCGGGSFKSQFKRADKSGAIIALILGDEEIKTNSVGVKFLREERPQETFSQASLEAFIKQYFHWS